MRACVPGYFNGWRNSTFRTSLRNWIHRCHLDRHVNDHWWIIRRDIEVVSNKENVSSVWKFFSKRWKEKENTNETKRKSYVYKNNLSKDSCLRSFLYLSLSLSVLFYIVFTETRICWHFCSVWSFNKQNWVLFYKAFTHMR